MSPNSPLGARIATAGRILLGVALLAAGTGHLTFARSTFQAQVPAWVPLDPDVVVVASGIVEILLGVGLIIPWRFHRQMGLVTALFFITIFPGNIAQFVEHTDAFGLTSDIARGIRLLFQPVLVLWALWCTSALSLFSHTVTGRMRH